jgi:hypothetical protein
MESAPKVFFILPLPDIAGQTIKAEAEPAGGILASMGIVRSRNL